MSKVILVLFTFSMVTAAETSTTLYVGVMWVILNTGSACNPLKCQPNISCSHRGSNALIWFFNFFSPSLSHAPALLMPWPMRPVNDARAASLPLRRLSTATESCIMSSALCVPSVSSSSQRDSSMRYCCAMVIWLHLIHATHILLFVMSSCLCSSKEGNTVSMTSRCSLRPAVTSVVGDVERLTSACPDLGFVVLCGHQKN